YAEFFRGERSCSGHCSAGRWPTRHRRRRCTDNHRAQTPAFHRCGWCWSREENKETTVGLVAGMKGETEKALLAAGFHLAADIEEHRRRAAAGLQYVD